MLEGLNGHDDLQMTFELPACYTRRGVMGK